MGGRDGKLRGLYTLPHPEESTMPIAEGKKAPPFTLPDTDGRATSLADFAGKNVILYFYPRDNTPG